MTFKEFQKGVNDIVLRSGTKTRVGFYHDHERNRFFANFPDGMRIVGNPCSLRIRVQWGSGHVAFADLQKESEVVNV